MPGDGVLVLSVRIQYADSLQVTWWFALVVDLGFSLSALETEFFSSQMSPVTVGVHS